MTSSDEPTPPMTEAAALAALEPRCRPIRSSPSSTRCPLCRPGTSGADGRGESWQRATPGIGLLTTSGWYGKQFDSAESVHPLLFRTPKGALFPLDPARIPLRLAGRVPATVVSAAYHQLDLLMPLLRARGPKARLRSLEYRGKVSAAMVYDRLPIIDVFRRVDATTLLGVMDMRSAPQPYFFILSRAYKAQPLFFLKLDHAVPDALHRMTSSDERTPLMTEAAALAALEPRCRPDQVLDLFDTLPTVAAGGHPGPMEGARAGFFILSRADTAQPIPQTLLR